MAAKCCWRGKVDENPEMLNAEKNKIFWTTTFVYSMNNMSMTVFDKEMCSTLCTSHPPLHPYMIVFKMIGSFIERKTYKLYALKKY